MRVSGTWPGVLILRQNWAKATARPWNDSSPGASLRLERGSSEFLVECADHLIDAGAQWVGSPPIDSSSASVWESAGFQKFLTLDLYGRDLQRPFEAPTRDVALGAAADLPAAIEIDRLAFDLTWQLGSLGIAEARAATPRSAFLVTHEDDIVRGFAIVGLGGTIGYLQRLAVHPSSAGSGHGRSLLRASLEWCHRRGATQQLLNTRPGNEAAGGLYHSEGYSVNQGALSVLRYDG